jgi:putative hemolysin
MDGQTAVIKSIRQNKPIDCGAVLLEQVPRLSAYPALVRQSVVIALQKLVCEDRINAFLIENAMTRDFQFIDQVFRHLKIEYSASDRDIENIPVKGRVIIVANHPLGGLDGLALLRLVSNVRRDVRIVVNELLLHISQLNNLSLPVDALGGDTKKADIYRIRQALYNDEAVIIFPAGEVSRAGAKGIRDRQWLPGFIHLAKATRSPVLPIHIKARNSALFYAISRISQPLSMLMLPREMLGFKGKISFTIGQIIAPGVIDGLPLSRKKQAKLVSDHLLRIGSGKTPLFATQTPLIDKCDRRAIQAELEQAEILGKTADNKTIFLFYSTGHSVVLEEIGRLRERTFRFVGEGTGHCKDLDDFDYYYRHLILWDESACEIVGAYRLGEIWKWPHHDSRMLYSATLFDYTEAATELFIAGLELGRSFVQPEYWGKRSLDYLWQGIGAYLARHPQVKYLFGLVSLSQNLPKKARDLLVCHYRHYCPDPQHLAYAKTPYVCDAETESLYAGQGNNDDSETAFTALKSQLAFMGIKIPTLYKQYTDLCLPGGTRFCGFNIDENFGHCVDGLVVVDLDQVKPKKRTRYIERHNMG